jgi:hypothetical protein
MKGRLPPSPTRWRLGRGLQTDVPKAVLQADFQHAMIRILASDPYRYQTQAYSIMLHPKRPLNAMFLALFGDNALSHIFFNI